MPSNKKPRKPYVRKPINLMAHMEAQDRVRLLAYHEDTRNSLITLKIKNHDALCNIRLGDGTADDIKTLVRAVNMCEAFMLLEIGDEYKADQVKAKNTIKSVCARAFDRHKFILTASELSMANLFLEIHDAQLEVCTLGEYNDACEIVSKSINKGISEKLDIYNDGD